MAFDAITSGQVASAEPVTTDLFTKVKDNFDDHEDRIQAMEVAGTDDPPLIFRVNGRYLSFVGLLKTTTSIDFTITGIRILVDVAGSAGTVEVDVKRKRGGGAYESVLTTLPSVVYTAGNDALSSNAVLDVSKVDIQAGDILRLDITSSQTDGLGFLVRIDYSRG